MAKKVSESATSEAKKVSAGATASVAKKAKVNSALKASKAENSSGAKKTARSVKKVADVEVQDVAVHHESAESASQKIEFKQVVVGFVILCFAAILMVISFFELQGGSWWDLFFKQEKLKPLVPTDVMVMFGTTTEQPVEYEIYYTVARETWFSDDHRITVQGKAGQHTYVVHLPVDKIYNLRLDFGRNPGWVRVHHVRLLGTQSADLSDFADYRFNQLELVPLVAKGKLIFKSTGKDPFIYYKDDLLDY